MVNRVATFWESSEITAARDVLQSADIWGVIFTLDATGIQKARAVQRSESGGDSTLAFKANLKRPVDVTNESPVAQMPTHDKELNALCLPDPDCDRKPQGDAGETPNAGFPGRCRESSTRWVWRPSGL